MLLNAIRRRNAFYMECYLACKVAASLLWRWRVWSSARWLISMKKGVGFCMRSCTLRYLGSGGVLHTIEEHKISLHCTIAKKAALISYFFYQHCDTYNRECIRCNMLEIS